MSKKNKSKFIAEIKELDCPDKLIVSQRGKKKTYSFRGNLASEFLEECADSIRSQEED